MKAGFADAVITPPVGTPMEGFNQPPATAIHDDLRLRCLWLEDGGEVALVVGMDLLFMERRDMDRLKGAVARVLGLLPRQVLVNFSHNHSGPRISRWFYTGAPEPIYLDLLEDRLLAAAGAARERLTPVHLEAGMASTGLPISRRRPNAEGVVEFRPYPEGPVCDALPVCTLRASDGSLVALLFSASCHPSSNHESLFSAEYPGVAIRHLNRHFGTDGALFLQGAGGDAKTWNIATPDHHFRDATWEDVEEAGKLVAQDVIAAVQAGLDSVSPCLRTALTEVDLPLGPGPTAAHCEAALHRDPRNAWAADMLAHIRIRGSVPAAVPIQMHLLQLGRDLCFLGLEGELGSELGSLILVESPARITFPLGYTNGSRINIPCDRQLPEGGYGVDTFWEYHWPARLAPGIDDRIREGLRELTSRACGGGRS